jgi:hypothetical protein
MMKYLLISTAVIEAGTGIVLVVTPALVVHLLLGSAIAGAAVPLGRIAGVALLALGVACGIASGEAHSRAAKGLASAMVIYNIGTVVVLGAAGIQSQAAGIFLWLAVALHASMSIWCVKLLPGNLA